MRRLASALFLALSLLTVEAADWKTSNVETKKPVAGKNLQETKSPDGKYTFFLREGEQGDFAWFYAYVQEGKQTTLLGSFNEVSKIVWSKDSLTFLASQAVDSNRVEELEAQYLTVTRQLKTKVLRTVKLEN